jgi:hypothetical protein
MGMIGSHQGHKVACGCVLALFAPLRESWFSPATNRFLAKSLSTQRAPGLAKRLVSSVASDNRGGINKEVATVRVLIEDKEHAV